MWVEWSCWPNWPDPSSGLQGANAKHEKISFHQKLSTSTASNPVIRFLTATAATHGSFHVSFAASAYATLHSHSFLVTCFPGHTLSPTDWLHARPGAVSGNIWKSFWQCKVNWFTLHLCRFLTPKQMYWLLFNSGFCSLYIYIYRK